MGANAADYLCERYLCERLMEWGDDDLLLSRGWHQRDPGGVTAHQDSLRFVQTRHQEMAAFMACGHAKYTGEVGVCLATSAPGAIRDTIDRAMRTVTAVIIPADAHVSYCTGSIGLLGAKPSWDMMQDCETLLMVGSSFPYPEFLPTEGRAKGVQVDLSAWA